MPPERRLGPESPLSTANGAEGRRAQPRRPRRRRGRGEAGIAVTASSGEAAWRGPPRTSLAPSSLAASLGAPEAPTPMRQATPRETLVKTGQGRPHAAPTRRVSRCSSARGSLVGLPERSCLFGSHTSWGFARINGSPARKPPRTPRSHQRALDQANRCGHRATAAAARTMGAEEYFAAMASPPAIPNPSHSRRRSLASNRSPSTPVRATNVVSVTSTRIWAACRRCPGERATKAAAHSPARLPPSIAASRNVSKTVARSAATETSRPTTYTFSNSPGTIPPKAVRQGLSNTPTACAPSRASSTSSKCNVPQR